MSQSQVSNTSGLSSSNNGVCGNQRGYRWAVKQKDTPMNRSKFFTEPMCLY